ncbi:MAG: hypothetical protein C4B59_05685 [Candidatus Methanogaster sp.]|uniref:Uncharacterized protein n=1 Tax=Candidatus Methanogaster sp. TaxID=3386292 RepID=A0AC61L470_9EURY|nr:MAG: hypothetical protein C4B59_05685 [ANME-2 cluster archaeon]
MSIKILAKPMVNYLYIYHTITYSFNLIEWISMDIIEKLLDIPEIEIENIELDGKGDVIITVRSTINVTRCHERGRKINKLHGHDKATNLKINIKPDDGSLKEIKSVAFIIKNVIYN